MKYKITLVDSVVFSCDYYYIHADENIITLVFKFDESTELDVLNMLLVAVKNGSATEFFKSDDEFLAVVNVLQIQKVEFK